MGDIVAVRHGQTDWNVAGKFQGWQDMPLNDEGRREVARLVVVMTAYNLHFPIDAIVTSPLIRAYHTAKPVGDKLGIPIIVDDRLKECNFGSWEGLTWPEVEERFGKRKEDVYGKPFDFRPYGGESDEDVFARHVAAFTEHSTGRKRTLFFGHGRGLSTTHQKLFGEPLVLVNTGFRCLSYPK